MSTTLVILIAAVCTALAVGGLIERRRREPGVDAGNQLARTRGSDSDVVIVAPPPGSDLALLIGPPEQIKIWEQAGLTARGPESTPFPALIKRAIALKRTSTHRRAATLANEATEGRYLRLSDKSLADLRAGGGVLGKSNELLGVVKSGEGKFKDLLRFTGGGAMAVDPPLALAAMTVQAVLGLQRQLEAIEQQLVEVQRTLSKLTKDIQVDRLTKVLSAQETLGDIAERIRRRGEIDDSDWIRIAVAETQVREALLNANFHVDDLTTPASSPRNRKQRLQEIDRLQSQESLTYWLSYYVQAELAHTRWEILKLLHDSSHEPEYAAQLERETRLRVAARADRRAEVATRLRELVDPKSQTRSDPLRLRSRRGLTRRSKDIEKVLDEHEGAFGPRLPAGVLESADRIRAGVLDTPSMDPSDGAASEG